MQTLYLFNISVVRDVIKSRFLEICCDHHPHPGQIAELPDWFVERALSYILRVKCKLHLTNFCPNDFYEFMYSGIGVDVEIAMYEIIVYKDMHYPEGTRVKHLISGNNLFLSD